MGTPRHRTRWSNRESKGRSGRQDARGDAGRLYGRATAIDKRGLSKRTSNSERTVAEWTIESRSFSIPFVGGGYTHTYHAILDEKGSVIAEYHGVPVDDNGKIVRGIGAFTRDDLILTSRRFDKGRDGMRPPRGGKIAREVVFSGSEGEVRAIDGALRAEAEKIDAKDLEYAFVHIFREAQNNNSVYATNTLVADGAARRFGKSVQMPERLADDSILWGKKGLYGGSEPFRPNSYAPGKDRILLNPDELSVSQGRSGSPTPMPRRPSNQPSGRKYAAPSGQTITRASTTTLWSGLSLSTRSVPQIHRWPGVRTGWGVPSPRAWRGGSCGGGPWGPGSSSGRADGLPCLRPTSLRCGARCVRSCAASARRRIQSSG